MSPKKVSRRDFIKTGAVAGGATIIGLSVGLSSLPTGQSAISDNAAAVNTLVPASQTNADISPQYVAKTRRYYLYATDGIVNVPQDPTATTHRQVYMYGFAKPMSDTRPIGQPGGLGAVKPFADLNWVDPLDPTGQPIMRGKAQLTAPPIWGIEGDTLEITLFNLGFLYRSDIMDPHTAHLHGVHAPTYYDGIPELSFGIPMWTGVPPIDNATIANHSFTYRMFCERPGTYMYHCHVEASEHVQMGMYGPMWIYPRQYSGGGFGYNNALTAFGQEVLLLMSEFDTRWHDMLWDPTLPTPGSNPIFANFNPVDYRPNFWFVNGIAFPDTVLPGKYTCGYQPGTATTADTLLTYYPGVTAALVAGAPPGWTVPPVTPLFAPRQPVQTYVHSQVAEKTLVRLLNMGFQYQPMHFHGVMPTVVGKDTFAWVPQSNPMFGTPTDERRRIFTQGIFSGETYDMIAVYPDKAAISAPVYGFINAVPAPGDPTYPPPPYPVGPPNNTIPPFMAYSPWDTVWGTVLPAVAEAPAIATGLVPSADNPLVTSPGFMQGYPLFYLWHVHDDYRVTNDGVYPGGGAVLVRIDRAGSFPAKPRIPATLIPA